MFGLLLAVTKPLEANKLISKPLWGIKVHQEIAAKAIYLLPKGLFAFYKAQEPNISKGAGMPDIRRIKHREQSVWHYTDFQKFQCFWPENHIPHNLDSVENKVFTDSVYKWGIAPWHLNKLLKLLERAFLYRDEGKIVWLSAEIAHFAADLCVPLHNTSDYDGRSLGFKGLHKAWESELPKLYFDLLPIVYAKPEFLKNPWVAIWSQSSNSFMAWESMKESFRNYSNNQKIFGNQLSISGKGATKSSSTSQLKYLKGSQWTTITTQYKRSVEFTASLWYTAWVNAGMPEMNLNTPFNWTEEQIAHFEMEYEQWKVRQWETDPCGN